MSPAHYNTSRDDLHYIVRTVGLHYTRGCGALQLTFPSPCSVWGHRQRIQMPGVQASMCARTSEATSGPSPETSPVPHCHLSQQGWGAERERR